jgi:adenine-specific DNA-methyltransferase
LYFGLESLISSSRFIRRRRIFPVTTVPAIVVAKTGIGAYSTPPMLARFLVSWAVRSPEDVTLDPCTGDGVFMEQAADRLIFLGLQDSLANHLVGVEIDEKRADDTSRKLHMRYGTAPKIIPRGFFEVLGGQRPNSFDAVVGNPPFARYRDFVPKNERELAFRFLADFGFKPSKMTNAWVPFLVAAIHLLKPKGRLAMVMPAELLQVSYAAPIREYLHTRFGFIYVVSFSKLVFPSVEQEVILLMGTKGEGRGLHLIEYQDASDLELLHKFRVPQEPVQDSKEKWTQYFLNDSQRGTLRKTLADPRIKRLAEIASVDVGVVTGYNDFFLLDRELVKKWGIESCYLVPVVARTVATTGATFTKEEWRQGRALYLLVVKPEQAVSRNLRKYLAKGERERVNEGYKCSFRDPWYAIPYVWTPDAFLFRQIGALPRIVLNKANITCTDTIHRVQFNNKKQSRAIVSCFYNSLTIACAEMFGRSYGGGVLELMPSEAEKLPIPLVGDGNILGEMDRLVREGSAMSAIEVGDERILHEEFGLSRVTISTIRDAWLSLSKRRKRRYGEKVKSNPTGLMPLGTQQYGTSN